jgi:hypothetical protein
MGETKFLLYGKSSLKGNSLYKLDITRGKGKVKPHRSWKRTVSDGAIWWSDSKAIYRSSMAIRK